VQAYIVQALTVTGPEATSNVLGLGVVMCIIVCGDDCASLMVESYGCQCIGASASAHCPSRYVSVVPAEVALLMVYSLIAPCVVSEYFCASGQAV
jgi:hypothetical protein